MSQRGAAIMVAAGGVALSCVALGFAIVVWCAPYSESPHLAQSSRSVDGRFVVAAIAQVLWTFFALASVALPPEQLPRWMRPKPIKPSDPGTLAFSLVMAILVVLMGSSLLATSDAIAMSDKPLLQTSSFRSLPLSMCLVTQFLGIFALRLNRPPSLQPAVA